MFGGLKKSCTFALAKRKVIACRRSSAVEHVICNLGVGGPNPSAGSKKEDEISPSFFYFPSSNNPYLFLSTNKHQSNTNKIKY